MRPKANPFVKALDRVPGGLARRVRESGRLSRILRPVVNRLTGDEPIAVTVRSGPARGVRVVIDPRDEKFYWAGTHEPEVQRALVEVLAPGDVFWDVGAHIGFFAFLARTRVAETGRVVAFEPLPANRQRLAEGLRLNGYSNVEVRASVVAGHIGKATLRGHSQSTRWSLRESDTDGTTSIAVPSETLDEVYRESGAPNLIKIDVEGAEIEVVKGAAQLLADRRPRMLVEFHEDDLLEQARALLPQYSFRQLGPTQWLLA